MKSYSVQRTAYGAKDFFLCLLSAILLILSFPNFDFWIFAWFGFVPLFFAIKNKTKVKAFLIAYLTGIIFWTGIIYWLVHVTLPGTIILILYLAIYFGIFGLIFTYSLQLTAYSFLFIPSVWVLLEYIRSHLFTGFPWALLGYSQYLNLPIIQIADITGAWGVSFLIMMVNVAVFIAISHKLSAVRKKQKLSLFLVISILLFVLIYGYFRIYSLQLKTYSLAPLKVSVIQGNIPQELKWDPGARDYIIHKYLEISRKALQDKPDLIIWPEAALPVIPEEEPLYYERVISFAKEIKIPLLLGAVTKRGELYYNSALQLQGEGVLLNRYDKLHLVPFGEYIPLKEVLPFLQTIVPIGDITAGKEYTIFRHPDAQAPRRPVRFSVLICFEDLFPELSRNFVKKGAQFLVNITNDAWYKKTAASFQHLQASVFRAVENRIYLARAANTGVSGFIALSGKIISLVQDESGREIFIDGNKTQEILIPRNVLTFYTRYGDVFILFCLVLGLCVIIRSLKLKAHS